MPEPQYYFQGRSDQTPKMECGLLDRVPRQTPPRRTVRRLQYPVSLRECRWAGVLGLHRTTREVDRTRLPSHASDCGRSELEEIYRHRRRLCETRLAHDAAISECPTADKPTESLHPGLRSGSTPGLRCNPATWQKTLFPAFPEKPRADGRSR